MTYYSASPPLVRRASELWPQDRLWRPPPSPPKDETSPRPSPRSSPQAQPNASNSPRLHHSSFPRLRPTIPSPSPHHREAAVPQARQVSPTPAAVIRSSHIQKHPVPRHGRFCLGFQARPPQPSTRALFHPSHPPTTERQVIAHSGTGTGPRACPRHPDKMTRTGGSNRDLWVVTRCLPSGIAERWD